MATPVLTALISTKTGDRTTLEKKVTDGEGAKVELSEILDELGTLGEIQSIHDAALARANTIVTGSKAAVVPLQSSAPYTSAAAAIAAGLSAKKLDDGGMSGVVDKPLPPAGKTYADYVGALSKVDTSLATAVADEAAKRIALVARRGMIDVRIAALTGYAGGVEARFARAKAFLTSATLAAQSNSVAAAWWALSHVKALLPGVAAADATTLATAVDTACDDYATAYDDWVKARDLLDKTLADRAAADADLAKADAQTLAALATFVG